MPKVRNMTNSTVRREERKRFLRQKMRKSKVWRKSENAGTRSCNVNQDFPIIERFAECFRKMYEGLSLSKNTRKPCFVCLRLHNMMKLQELYLTSDDVDQLHNLKSSTHVLKQYSEHFPRIFSKMHQCFYHIHDIISINDKEHILTCENCSKHLRRGTTIPKYSIPNYFFPEPVPKSLSSLTVAELLMVSRVFPRCILYTLTGDPSKNHKYLKGKSYLMN